MKVSGRYTVTGSGSVRTAMEIEKVGRLLGDIGLWPLVPYLVPSDAGASIRSPPQIISTDSRMMLTLMASPCMRLR